MEIQVWDRDGQYPSARPALASAVLSLSSALLWQRTSKQVCRASRFVAAGISQGLLFRPDPLADEAL
jgi:hypothetical protein